MRWTSCLTIVALTGAGFVAGCFASDTRQAPEREGAAADGEGAGEGEEADGGDGKDGGDGGEPAACAAGDVARGFALGQQLQSMGFTTGGGQRLDPADHCGEVVLLEAGSETCGVCAAILPGLIELYGQRREEGLFVLYVLTANRQGRPPTVADLQRFQAEHDLPFPVVADSDGMLVFFVEGDMAIPIDLLADRQLVLRLKGGSVDRAHLEEEILRLLAAPR